MCVGAARCKALAPSGPAALRKRSAADAGVSELFLLVLKRATAVPVRTRFACRDVSTEACNAHRRATSNVAPLRSISLRLYGRRQALVNHSAQGAVNHVRGKRFGHLLLTRLLKRIPTPPRHARVKARARRLRARAGKRISRRQRPFGGAMTAGSSRTVRLDPLALPVRFRSACDERELIARN